jgi:hypothetical protein
MDSDWLLDVFAYTTATTGYNRWNSFFDSLCHWHQQVTGEFLWEQTGSTLLPGLTRTPRLDRLQVTGEFLWGPTGSTLLLVQLERLGSIGSRSLKSSSGGRLGQLSFLVQLERLGSIGSRSQEPHCVTSQKMAFFTVTAVKTSNHT